MMPENVETQSWVTKH